MKLSDDARQAIHDWRWGPYIEDPIERQEMVDAMIKKVMDTFTKLEAHFMVQIKALMENRERWHQRWKIAHDILNTTQRKQYEEELDTLTGGADWFCPACDAGAGHCNGPHDEIPF